MAKFEGIIDKYTSDPKKAVSLIIIALAVVLIVYLALKILKGATGGLLNRISNTISSNENIDAVDRRTNNDAGGTWTDQEYEQMADRLYAAMNGPTTDEDAVAAVMKKIKNDSDWARLVAAFGLRDSSWNWFDTPHGLEQWIVEDFSSRDDIEKYINGPLSQGECTTRF
ncbi:MAG: hypothetical protein J5642_02595 [Bacteroidales bacterium]|nr:hypothetical protein [Bacteroidales bacterium]